MTQGKAPADQNKRPCSGGCSSLPSSRFTRERSQVRNPPRPSVGSPASAGLSAVWGRVPRAVGGRSGRFCPLLPISAVGERLEALEIAPSRRIATRRVKSARLTTRVRAPLSACAVAVLAPRPAAGPALAFLQLLLGPSNAARPGGLLLGGLDPADELVAGQWRDVVPGFECRRAGQQHRTEVRG